MIHALAAAAVLVAGTYTNEEQVYFADAAKGAAPPWVGIAVAADGSAKRVDAFGAGVAGPLPGGHTPTADGYSATLERRAVNLTHILLR